MKMITRTFTANKNMKSTTTTTTTTTSTIMTRIYKRNHCCFELSMPLYVLLLTTLLIMPMILAQTSSSSSSAAAAAAGVAPPPQSAPHAAALASPGAGGGTSSIIEQFSPNCSAVSHIFKARGIDGAEIPQKPSNEMVLRYCESPSVGTCCTYTMETKMAMQSRLQLEKHSKEQITKMSSTLAAKAQKFNEIFRKLLLESKEEFHNMFTRTYGVIYQQNSYVFSDLFNELENYYVRGRVDLIVVMDKFFNTLYQKMFQVLNAQYAFDEKYLHCVSEHMKELKPFGDVPDKLSVQIKRSFVATRTYGQALATAADVAKKLISVRLNADCTAALTKMQHCGACKGYAEKPCTNYCVNVIKGCLAYLAEFDVEWENFVMSMDKVAERLLGSFNIVMVVEPINIKISEAIMNFQDAGQDITSRVFQGCGRPTLGRSKRSISPKFSTSLGADQHHHHQNYHNQHHNQDDKVIKKRATLFTTPTVEQLDADILDIDATIDEAIVLREKRAAEPGSGNSGGGGGGGGGGVSFSASSEANTSPRNGSSGSNDGGSDNSNSRGGGGGGGGNNQNRRNQNRRKQQQQHRKNDDVDYTGRDPILDKMVRDIRQRVKDSKKFWSNLPHQICSNDEISSSSDVDGMCWNGHTIDRYMHSVTTEHSRNPEFPGNPVSTRQTSLVATQLYHLKNAINHLRNAYNGQDVDWSEQEEPIYGSGSGAGSDTDDDDEDDDEGSGLSGGPFMTPSHKPDHTVHPAVHSNNNLNGDDEDDDGVEDRADGTLVTHTSRPKYTGTTGGAGTGGGVGGINTNTIDGDNGHDDNDGDDDDDLKSSASGSGATTATPKAAKMSLRRALLVYLLPLYMAWFGGLCADLL